MIGNGLMSVYLCGPILGCTDEECKNWREAAKQQGFNCIDPMRRDYRGKELQYYQEIVEDDKLDIMMCDALLVNYIKPSVGTSMEILFAWEQRKRIIVVAAKGSVISPWLKYHSDAIVETFAEAFQLLKQYDAPST